MITQLRVSNYRSLGEGVRVALGAFNVLVGPNGSGKSNLLDVLRFVAEALTIGIDGGLA